MKQSLYQYDLFEKKWKLYAVCNNLNETLLYPQYGKWKLKIETDDGKTHMSYYEYH